MLPDEFAILLSITRCPVLEYNPSMGLVPYEPLIEYQSMLVLNTLSNEDRATVMAGRSADALPWKNPYSMTQSGPMPVVAST
jgi:hypothetical protein